MAGVTLNRKVGLSLVFCQTLLLVPFFSVALPRFAIAVGVLVGIAVKVWLMEWLVAEAKMLKTAVLVRAEEGIVGVGESVPVIVSVEVGVMVPVEVMVSVGVPLETT